MADRIRHFDWAATPLGAMCNWPDRLRSAVETMLATAQLSSLAVGPERIFLYNDEASRHYGRRHPGVLGLPLARAFPGDFPKVAPFYDRVFQGESLHIPDQALDTTGEGAQECFEAYLTPIRSTGGDVIAAQMAGFAIDDRRRAEARQALLLELSDALRNGGTSAEIRQAAMRLLGEHLKLARIYFFEVERDDQGQWVDVIERGYQRDIEQTEFIGRQTLDAFGAFMFQNFARGEVVAVNDIETHPRLTDAEREAYRAAGIGAFIHVPLLRGGEYATGIAAHDLGPRAWRDAEFDLIREVAARVWLHLAEVAQRESQIRQAFRLEVADAMRPMADPAGIQRAAMRLLARHLGVDSVVYYEFDGDGDRVVSREGPTNPRLTLPAISRLRDFGPGFHPDLNVGRTISYEDSETDPRLRRHRATWRATGIRAGVVAVSMKRGGLAAALAIAHGEPRRWTPAELRLVEDVAERTWDAVERARVEAALRISEETLATELANAVLLRDLAERVVTEESGEALYEEVLAAAVSIAEADAGTIQVADAETQSLRPLVTQNFSPEVIQRFGEVDADGRTACAAALTTGRRAYVDFADQSDDPGCRLLLDNGIRSALAIPLLSRTGRLLGMLNTHWRKAGHRATDRELRFLELIARQAADLIEHREAQAVLRESEARLRQFGEASQDILWIRDAATLQWIYLTPAFETIYGVSRRDALAGDDYRNWQDLMVPEDRERAVAAIDRVRAGEHVTFEYRVKRPSDGQVRWLRNTDFPIVNAAGEVVLIGGIGHDFTEVREAALRLQTLVEGIPQLVWRAVDGGVWTWGSPQWTEFTGQGENAYMGAGWLDALHPDDRLDALDAWSHAVAQGGFEVEYRIRRERDGAYRWFQTRATPVRDPGGTIVEWLGTSTDIHDLRELQERQKVLVAELQHRTRNLMGVVRSVADKTVQNSADLSDFRGRFRDRLEALARVQGLLSRLNEHDRVTFDELLDTELAAMNGTADRVTHSGPKGVRLRSSTVQTLAMALHELATNAMKYGALSDAGGHLRIAWDFEERGPGDEPWLHIDWRESGIGRNAASLGNVVKGHGRELIERALPYQLGAKTSYDLGADGVHCVISIPVSAIAGHER